MIDIERLSSILERGADAQAAAAQARRHLQDALTEHRDHNADHNTMQERFQGREASPVQQATIVASEAKRSALAARVERRRAALPDLERRASLWSSYCDSLRTLAQKHGVQL